ncbi:ribonuclease H-like protein [Poronia punctata]|nr:ribonuclease H-like protein [Poronia punctata]
MPPLGYYLGQGLIPLLPDSSDDEEGPCELPDGRLVCGPHGRVVCYKCCSDYSFVDAASSDDDDDDDDDDDAPFELPDGRLVCRPHGLVVCGICCSDYSFMEDILKEEEDDNAALRAECEALYWQLDPQNRAEIDARWGPPRSSRPQAGTNANQGTSSARGDDSIPGLASNMSQLDLDMPRKKGTGRIFPGKFIPPSPTTKPISLFPGKPTYGGLTRYIHLGEPKKILIFTDGACLDNGRPNPRAGWAFVHGPGHLGQACHKASGRLESKGPFGDPSVQSSNRAELRAVIAALRFRHWVGEGYDTLVIATDSEYVTKGATEWARTWFNNGWRTAGKADVKNKDLWEMLLGEVERWHDEGLSVQFWRIPREWNTLADEAAKKGATESQVPDRWMEVIGTCV